MAKPKALKPGELPELPSDLIEKPKAITALLDDVKRDTRPPKGAWHGGRYLRRCTACDSRFEGAVNSTQCADCAYQGQAHVEA